MTRPNFLVIGSAKSGTTTLWSRLREHPDVFMSDVKEIQFFSRDELYGRGIQHYDPTTDPVLAAELGPERTAMLVKQRQEFLHRRFRMKAKGITTTDSHASAGNRGQIGTLGAPA